MVCLLLAPRGVHGELERLTHRPLEPGVHHRVVVVIGDGELDVDAPLLAARAHGNSGWNCWRPRQ